MHAAKERDAGYGAKQHAHQHWHKGQQHPPAPERQQQQQQNTHGGAATDPGDFTAGLLLAAGGVKQAAGGQQLHIVVGRLGAAVFEQLGDPHGQLHVEGIAPGAGAQQYPVFAVGLGDQRAAADIQLYRATLRLTVLDTPGEAQPVVLAGHQAEPAKRVEQRLHTLLDKSLGVFDQLGAVGGREHGHTPAQQLFAQGREVGLQVPLDLFKQAAGLPLRAQLPGRGDGLLTVAAAHQHQHFAVEWLLHALFGAQLQRVRRVAGHQVHQIGRQRCTVTPLPAGECEHGQQQDQKATGQPAFTAQNRAAPLRSTVGC